MRGLSLHRGDRAPHSEPTAYLGSAEAFVERALNRYQERQMSTELSSWVRWSQGWRRFLALELAVGARPAPDHRWSGPKSLPGN